MRKGEQRASWRTSAVGPLVGVLVFGYLAAVACSEIVSPESAPIRCRIGETGFDPCPAPRRCVRGYCQANPQAPDVRPDPIPGCIPEPEECGNGIDDDCDGIVDNSFDNDGDGWQVCNGDCNDSDGFVSPDQPETCNGQDDNCNGQVDENAAAPCPGAGEQCFLGECRLPSCVDPGHECPAGQSCDLSQRPATCVFGGDCTTEGCPPGEVCIRDIRACVRLRNVGEPCEYPVECSSGSCIRAAALRPDDTTGQRVCGLACCSDADCPGGLVCWSGGTGARSCVPLPATRNSAGGPCTRPDQCSSGACFLGLPDIPDPDAGMDSGVDAGPDTGPTDAGPTDSGGTTDAATSDGGGPTDAGTGDDGSTDDGGALPSFAPPLPPLPPIRTCLAPCARNVDCPAGDEWCGQYDSTDRLGCMPRVGHTAVPNGCSSWTDCETGLCHGGERAFCAQPCGTSIDCPTGGDVGGTYCGMPETAPWIAICKRGASGIGQSGDACGSNDDCADNLCLLPMGQCADACCNDSHCPAGRLCRPIQISDSNGIRYRMVCTPR